MLETLFIIRWIRIVRIIIHTLTGLTLATFVLPVCNRWVRLGLIQWWCKRLLTCFNIRVTTSGQLPDIKTHGVMFVANHISWTDIHALNSIIPVRFIAKVEIRSWPIFGYLVKKSGTIFINRTRNRDAVRVLQIASHALKLNDNLCVFPEGTTTEGLSMMPFKSSLLQAAIDAQTTLVPVVIHYPLADGTPNLDAAYAGETTLIASMQRYLRMSAPTVHLHFCAPIATQGHTRQTLAKLAHQTIHSQLPYVQLSVVQQPVV